jgi:thiamine-phosphate pyrophosphorylase
MKLLFILDHVAFSPNLIKIAEQCADFCDLLWYRFKGPPTFERLKTAELLRKTLPNKTLILSYFPNIAQNIGFDGVHLNNLSSTPQDVKLNYPNLITGFSAHSVKECIDSSADYNSLSPIFKAKGGLQPLGLSPPPKDNIFLLGGINSSNVKEIIDLGYAGIAGISFYNEIEKIYRLCKAGV